MAKPRRELNYNKTDSSRIILDMELTGKVRLLLEPKSGVSQSTGNTWMSQEVVIDYYWWPNQRDASQVVMKVFGEDRIKQWNLQQNDEVQVRYHIEAHEYNGRWFNDTRIDGVTFVGASASKNPQPTTQQQPTGETAGTEGGKSDDLPF